MDGFSNPTFFVPSFYSNEWHNIIDKIIEDQLMKFIFLNVKWSTNNKFLFLKQQIENPFLKCHINLFIVFEKLQKITFAVNKLVYCYKLKRAKTYNTEDLFMNPICEGQKGTITIFENNTKYIFQIRELINSIQSNLSNCSHFFPDSKHCKNPYTNLPFHKSNLYNIYFAIKSYSYSMPILLEKFFLESFDLPQFCRFNSCLINEEYLNQYTKTTVHINNVLFMTKAMLIEYKIPFYINKDFPRYQLINIMRPYLDLYNKSQYYMNIEKAKMTSHVLRSKLYIFYKFNSIFGRKKITVKYNNNFQKQKTIEKIISFHDAHPPFNNIKNNFLSSHIERVNVPSSSSVTINNSEESDIEGEVHIRRRQRTSVILFANVFSSEEEDEDEYEDDEDQDEDIGVEVELEQREVIEHEEQ